ncbi:T9SS type A sorting domain-containing protein [candidate division KSB1 bacterium]|nr:T9SS type A sorting domain-containing protein [candidate division KSB1 bacterium]
MGIQVNNIIRQIFLTPILIFVFFTITPVPLFSYCDADFKADQTSGCAVLPVVFTDKSADATNWLWNFPGGIPASATGKGPHKVKYASPGAYDVKLDIICPNGKDTIIKEKYIVVTDCSCQADFNIKTISDCVPGKFEFTDASIGASNWTWTFSGGSPSSATGPGGHLVVYNKPGPYDVTLKINCQQGSDAITKKVVVNDCSCEADFSGTPTSGTAPFMVDFTNHSINATSWEWKFPGGEPGSYNGKQPPPIEYKHEGDYSVSLKIECQYGTDNEEKVNYIHVRAPYDYGDAPESYKTLQKDNGARHKIKDGVFLGKLIDAENDAKADTFALGDDNNNLDDEDGIFINADMVLGDTVMAHIHASAGGYLKAWFDFNRDGDWDDPDEIVCDNIQIGVGATDVPVIVPRIAKPGSTFARFRYSEDRIESYNGTINGGEVEDYKYVLFEFAHYDYGDAPAPFPTTLADNGARHFRSGLYLGDTVDWETNGHPTADAKGDDNLNSDDEDGITFYGILAPGNWFEVQCNVSGEGFIHAWMDFNDDGDWDDAGEYFWQEHVSPPYGYGRFFASRSTAIGEVAARFRFSTTETLDYDGPAIDGEVEDYMVRFREVTGSCTGDSLALAALYLSTNGPGWTRHTNWLTGLVRDWYGVTTSGCRVTALRLSDNNLAGTLPPEMGNLTELVTLDLRSNSLTGPIPPEIGNLGQLIFLFLGGNELTGSLPPELGELTNCELLDVGSNSLTGTIPTEIFDLTNMFNLTLSNNSLTGPIPPEIGRLTELTDLLMDNNNLSGTLPAEIYTLSNLARFRIDINLFSGTISPDIENMVNLQKLYLRDNDFTGEIPTEIGTLLNLQELILDSNDFSGSILPKIYPLTELIYLSLGRNEFTGNISADIGGLIHLRSLYLDWNNFTGTLPEELYTLTDLRYLNLNTNNFTGTIAPAIGNLIHLYELHLGENTFAGAIPTEIRSLNELRALSVSGNQFVDFPDISSLPALSQLYMNDNCFTFEDIETNIGVAFILYAPQDSVGSEQDISLNNGGTLQLSVTVGGTANVYAWMKDDTDIPGANRSTLKITQVSRAHAGDYVCRITNTIAPHLTLYSRPAHVTIIGITDVDEQPNEIPKKFAILQNFPNPFNPNTKIIYHLPKEEFVTITIINMQGQTVRTLVNASQSPGVKSMQWDGRNEDGKKVNSGMYLYRIKAGDFSETRKMLLLK